MVQIILNLNFLRRDHGLIAKNYGINDTHLNFKRPTFPFVMAPSGNASTGCLSLYCLTLFTRDCLPWLAPISWYPNIQQRNFGKFQTLGWNITWKYLIWPNNYQTQQVLLSHLDIHNRNSQPLSCSTIQKFWLINKFPLTLYVVFLWGPYISI